MIGKMEKPFGKKFGILSWNKAKVAQFKGDVRA